MLLVNRLTTLYNPRTMRKHLDEFVSSTSIHGINKAGNARWTRRRYVWLLLTLLMTGTLVAFIVEAFTNFLQYRSITKISAENKQNIEFPAVTICNMNMVKKTITQCNESIYANLDELFLNYGETLVIQDNLFPGLGSVKGQIPNGEEMLNCLYKYSNSIQEMLPICTWRGGLEPCSNLFKTTLTEMGVCFTFNGGLEPRHQSTYTGTDSGLRVFVDIRQDEYYYSATIQAGIKVVLHEPAEAPIPSLGGFMVAPGSSAEAVILRTREHRLDEPYGKCSQRTEGLLRRYSSYSEKACRMECMVDYLVSANGLCQNCRHFLHPGPERMCTYEELEKCFIFYRNATTSKFTSNCTCPTPCDTIQYDTSISYAGFMSNFMNTYFLNKGMFPTENYARDNFIELKIYYDSMIEVVVTEHPEFDAYEMLSNIGGLMGIFLGASLLSLVELVEFIVLCLRPQNRLKSTEISVEGNGMATGLQQTTVTVEQISLNNKNKAHLKKKIIKQRKL